MEAEERPAKLQKLSHDTNGSTKSQSAPDVSQLTADQLPAPQTTTEPQNSETPFTSHPPRPPREEPPDGLSRSAWKKQKRKAEWEAGREDRKIQRKEKHKATKARKREAIVQAKAAGVFQEPPRREPIRQQRVPIAFVLDCQFDKLMVDKEIISLGSQITRSYSDNSRAKFQGHMFVSGWGEETELRKRFEVLMKGQYRKWKGFVCTEKDFVEASRMARREMRGNKRLVGAFEKYADEKEKSIGKHEDGSVDEVENGADEAKSNSDRAKNDSGSVKVEVDDNVKNGADDVKNGTNVYEADAVDDTANFGSGADQASAKDDQHGDNLLADEGEVIYLTSDSPDTLTELKPYHTYIIGGIVDKNRHKGICYKKALDRNDELKVESVIDSDPTTVNKIKTAKLPIGEYMNMTARHVLTTNHVVEIMLKWLETGDWGEAFLAVMPKRKGGTLKTGSATNGDEDDQSDLNFGSESEAEGDLAEVETPS